MTGVVEVVIDKAFCINEIMELYVWIFRLKLTHKAQHILLDNVIHSFLVVLVDR